MKRGIVLVSFGTSYRETREKTIDNLEAVVRKRYAGYTVETAFTSNFILKKIENTDKKTKNIDEALDKFIGLGVEEVILQPTHLLPGEEYEKILEKASEYEDRFKTLVVGKPLLYSIEDCENVLDVLKTENQKKLDEAVIYMGHGTAHLANYIYPTLNYILYRGDPGYYVATVEGYPELVHIIGDLIKSNYRKVCLVPLMFVAGDHALNDMAGSDSDSWKSILTKSGYQVRTVIKGLGQIPRILDLYIEHIDNEIALLERKQ